MDPNIHFVPIQELVFGIFAEMGEIWYAHRAFQQCDLPRSAPNKGRPMLVSLLNSRPCKTAFLVIIMIMLTCGKERLSAQSLVTPTSPPGPPFEGAVFDVKSLSGINVTGFTVPLANNAGQNVVLIGLWKLNTLGSFVGHENTEAAWTPIGGAVVQSSSLATTPIGGFTPVPIPPGETQAFYVTFLAGPTQKFTSTTLPLGGVLAANLDAEIHIGRGGGPDQFDFNSIPVGWAGAVHYSPIQTFNDDVQLESIVAPAHDGLGCRTLSANEVVTIDVRNTGFNSLPSGTTLVVSYQVGTGSPVTEIVTTTATVPSWGTVTHTFATAANLSAPGAHTIIANVTLAVDVNPSNDTLSATVVNGGQFQVTNFPYTQHFPVPTPFLSPIPLPSDFVNETTDAVGPNSDWIIRSSATPNSGTGPSSSYTNSYAVNSGFAYVDGGSVHAAVSLRTPCFDFSNLSLPAMSFFMHSLNADTQGSPNTLAIDVHLFPANVISIDVFGPEGDTGPSWAFRTVDLSAFAGQKVQIVFRATSLPRLQNLTHDIAIDDISVEDNAQSLGQAPQLGLAVLDINAPRNFNSHPLNLGFGGPYFTTISPGANLVFKMSGQPSSPVIMFSGPLNPVAASYPGIGTIDLGGPVNLMNGIPTLLTLIGDGYAPGIFNSFFQTDTLGTAQIGFTVPGLPPGVLGNFQCAVATAAAPGLALSNAVQVVLQ